jgi:hypothetical protein
VYTCQAGTGFLNIIQVKFVLQRIAGFLTVVLQETNYAPDTAHVRTSPAFYLRAYVNVHSK